MTYEAVKEKVDEVLRNGYKDETIVELDYKKKPMVISFTRGIVIVTRGKENFIGNIYDKGETKISCRWSKVAY